MSNTTYRKCTNPKRKPVSSNIPLAAIVFGCAVLVAVVVVACWLLGR